MSVTSLSPDYGNYVDVRDRVENFHGNIVVYVHWEEHLSFCAALAFPLPPAMPFAALVDEVIKPHYAAHPQFPLIDWAAVEWMVDDKKITPDLGKSLAENGLHHKSLVRFWTPGLGGYKGSAS